MPKKLVPVLTVPPELQDCLQISDNFAELAKLINAGNFKELEKLVKQDFPIVLNLQKKETESDSQYMQRLISLQHFINKLGYAIRAYGLAIGQRYKTPEAKEKGETGILGKIGVNLADLHKKVIPGLKSSISSAALFPLQIMSPEFVELIKVLEGDTNPLESFDKIDLEKLKLDIDTKRKNNESTRDYIKRLNLLLSALETFAKIIPDYNKVISHLAYNNNFDRKRYIVSDLLQQKLIQMIEKLQIIQDEINNDHQKAIFEAVQESLKEEIKPKKNTITVRIWYRKSPEKRIKNNGVVSDGHISIEVCDENGERYYISLYPKSNTPPTQEANMASHFLSNVLHAPKNDDYAGAFMPPELEAAHLLVEGDEGYHYFEVKEIVFDCSKPYSLNMNNAKQWTKTLLDTYKEECDVLKVTEQPQLVDLDKLPIKSHAAFIRYNDELYYVNKVSKVCTKVLITPEKLTEFDNLTNPTDVAKVVTKQLEKIIGLTRPQHTHFYRYNILDANCSTIGKQVLEVAKSNDIVRFADHWTGIVNPQQVFDYATLVSNKLEHLNLIKQLDGVVYPDEKSRLKDIIGMTCSGIEGLIKIREFELIKIKKVHVPNEQKQEAVQSSMEEKAKQEPKDKVIQYLQELHDEILLFKNRADLDEDIKIIAEQAGQKLNAIIPGLQKINLGEYDTQPLEQIINVAKSYMSLKRLNDFFRGLDFNSRLDLVNPNIMQLKQETTRESIAKSVEEVRSVLQPDAANSIFDEEAIFFKKEKQIRELILEFNKRINQERIKLNAIEADIRNEKKKWKRNQVKAFLDQKINLKHDKSELIEAYQKNIIALTKALGVVEVELNFERPSITAIKVSDNNVLMKLKVCFHVDPNQDSHQLESIINDVINSIKNNNNVSAKVREQIAAHLNNNKLSYNLKLKLIMDLIEEHSPFITRYFRKTTKEAYDKIKHDAQLVCILQEFMQGKVSVVTLANRLENFAQNSPKGTEINSVAQKLKQGFEVAQNKFIDKFPEQVVVPEQNTDLEAVTFSIYQRLFHDKPIKQVYKKLFNRELAQLDLNAVDYPAKELKIKIEICLQKLFVDLADAYINKDKKQSAILDFRKNSAMIDQLIIAMKENLILEDARDFKNKIFALIQNHAKAHENNGAYIELVIQKLVQMKHHGIIDKDYECLKPSNLFEKIQNPEKDGVWDDLCNYTKAQLDDYNRPFRIRDRREILKPLLLKLEEIDKSGNPTPEKIQALIDKLNEASNSIRQRDHEHNKRLGKFSLFSYRNQEGSQFQKVLERIRDKAITCLIPETNAQENLTKSEIILIKGLVEQLRDFAGLKKLCNRDQIKQFLNNEFPEQENDNLNHISKWLANLDPNNIADSRKSALLIYNRLETYTDTFLKLKSRILGNTESTDAFINYFNEVKNKLHKFIITQEEIERISPNQSNILSTPEHELQHSVHKAIFLSLSTQFEPNKSAAYKYRAVMRDDKTDNAVRVRNALFEIEKGMKKIFPNCEQISFENTKLDHDKLDITIAWKENNGQPKTTSFMVHGFDMKNKNKLVCEWPNIKDRVVIPIVHLDA